jgi:hypothetical protein
MGIKQAIHAVLEADSISAGREKHIAFNINPLVVGLLSYKATETSATIRKHSNPPQTAGLLNAPTIEYASLSRGSRLKYCR